MKPYCKDFTIKLKYLQTTGKLVGIHKPTSQAIKTSLVVPETLESVKQYYLPESKALAQSAQFSDLLTKDDCESAIVNVDKLTDERTVTVLPKDQVQEIKESDLPKNIMNLTIHKAEEADMQMFPLKNSQSYVFYPDEKDPDNVQNYNLLVAVMQNSDLAFCSIVNLQNHEGLFRLSIWRNRLILVKQGYPEEINEHELPSEDQINLIPSNIIEKATSKFESLSEPIDSTTYKNRILQETENLKEAIDGGEEFEHKKIEVKTTTDLNDLLDSFDD